MFDLSLHAALIGDIVIAAAAFVAGIYVDRKVASKVSAVINTAENISSDAKHVAAAVKTAAAPVADAASTVKNLIAQESASAPK